MLPAGNITTDNLEQFAPDTDAALDPGINRYVLIPRRAGIEIIESCEGAPNHSFPDLQSGFMGIVEKDTKLSVPQ